MPPSTLHHPHYVHHDFGLHRVFDTSMCRAYTIFSAAFLGLCYVLATVPAIALPPTGSLLSDRQCVTGFWKNIMILIHIITFLLVPLAMKVLYDAFRSMNMTANALLTSQLSMAFILLAVTSEIASDAVQCWFYADTFTVLNFMVYFFLITSFALMSDALMLVEQRFTKTVNLVLAVLVFISAVLYSNGAANNQSWYKVPLYATFALMAAGLTKRAYDVVDNYRILWFPVFTVVVNLCFVSIMLTNGGDPYAPDAGDYVLANVFYHILQDLAIFAGLFLFTLHMYRKGREAAHDSERMPFV